MRERPIIFDAESVRAILDGTKTQTRRVVKQWEIERLEYKARMTWTFNAPKFVGYCPYGQPGDRLWVREKFAYEDAPLDRPGMIKVHYDYSVDPYTANWFPMPDTGIRFRYNSQGVRGSTDGVWRSPIHMPRWASRITLEITGVRVERVQDISDDDAQAEGVNGDSHPGTYIGTCRGNFALRWDAINGKRAPWASNPWVWVVEFMREDAEAL